MNSKAHIDIENDIQETKDGLFTFILRINNGEIVDYNRIEHIAASYYAGIEQEIITELTATYDNRSGTEESPVRDGDIQRSDKKRGGGSKDIVDHA